MLVKGAPGYHNELSEIQLSPLYIFVSVFPYHIPNWYRMYVSMLVQHFCCFLFMINLNPLSSYFKNKDHHQ